MLGHGRIHLIAIDPAVGVKSAHRVVLAAPIPDVRSFLNDLHIAPTCATVGDTPHTALEVGLGIGQRLTT